MRVVIMGASKVGITIASVLFKEGHKIAMIDLDEDAFNFIPDNLEVEKIVGSGTDPAILKQIEFSGADAFVAATTSDNVNISAVKTIKTDFGCKVTGKVIYDPARAKAFNEIEKGIICPIYDAALRFKESVIATPSQ